MYKQLYQAYVEDKENPQTFAGAMAAFALGSYMAYHNNYESDQKTNEIFQKLVKQMDAGIKSRWCPKMYADKRRANKKQRRYGIFEVWKLKIPFAVPVAVGRI